jgi:hypothetical protein
LDKCGEVANGDDAILGSQTPHQVFKIKPEIPPTVLVAEPVVEVEAVHVGDDGGHLAPGNEGRKALVILVKTPPVCGPA